MFDSVLIANRGEIACRIIRTCHRLGIRTIAVYSDADRAALHVAMADEARFLGASAPRHSYLDIPAIIDAAVGAGARAIHPGYGFLAENADFAEACVAAGIAFIGPPADVIRALGAKDRARSLAVEAGLDVVPGYDGDPDGFVRAAKRIGYPVVVKAIAGGGGRGMRVVADAARLDDAIAGARREAASAFGDDRLFIEKFIAKARHVEVQVFGDTHGNVVHMFERECSLQRRYQKLLEEAPAPRLADGLRRDLAEAALRLARRAGYVGAGTVEFLVAPDERFYFLETNTRLQVEHPVTEMITGLDLVEWQLRVAAGEPLPLDQNGIARNGHAIEARINAEDPTHEFAASTGRVALFRLPDATPQLRLETGIRRADAVTPFYDSLIAKIIVWGNDRQDAVQRLLGALGAVRIAGVRSNARYLTAVAASPEFAAGEFDVGFLERQHERFAIAPGPSRDAVAMAALALLRRRAETAAEAAVADPHSPWALATGWRLNAEGGETLTFRVDGRTTTMAVRRSPSGWLLDLPDGPAIAALIGDGPEFAVEIGGRQMHATAVWEGDAIVVDLDGEMSRFEPDQRLGGGGGDIATPSGLAAPMPGTVIDVPVQPGMTVSRGAVLVVLEAMKMEQTIRAPVDGVVEAVHVSRGMQVAEGAELISFRSGTKE